MSEPNPSAQAVPIGRAYEMLDDGSSFGGHTIVRCLAYDMMGTLYLVENRENARRETLFVFSSLVKQDAGFHERFLAQTKKLCALHHANLLNFNRPLLIQSSYCLVGEAFDGLSLPDHLMLLTGSQLSVSEKTEAINLPSAQVTPILEQVLAALAHAHEQKVLHLSLNAAKILRSNYGEVKVYGFHFLAILGQELFEMLVSAGIPPLRLDPNRSFLGTTDILSPEARLRQTLEYRSDLYAVGVDTHWLLTGRKPTSPYQPPSVFVPNLEPGWDAFIIRCLQRLPDARYASANTALADLRNLAHLVPAPRTTPLELLLPAEPAPEPPKEKKPPGSRPPQFKKSRPVKPPRRARPPLKRTQRLALIGVAALLFVGLGTWWYLFFMTDEDESPLNSRLVAARTRDGQTPNLRLSIDPASARVTINPGRDDFEVADGQLALNIFPGNYSLVIEAPNHTTKVVAPVAIAKGLDRVPEHLYVNLDPAWAQVDLVTVPGATVQARPEKGDVIYLGVAPENGTLRVTRGLAEGNFTFEASKEDYATATLPGQKLDYAKAYHIELKPVAKPATITLTSDPAGARVRLGAQVLGVTPLTTQALPVDTDLTLTLEAPGHRPATRTIRVRPNQTQSFNLGDLAARTGELALSFTLAGRAPTPEELRDTKILVNQAPYPGSTRRIPNVVEGAYPVQFVHGDYFPADQTVTVTDGMVSNVTADLVPRPARLIIQPNPAVPIVVTLNGQTANPGPDGAYLLAPEQTAKLRVEAQNFAGAAREFKLGPNQSATWDVPLQVLPGPVPSQNYTVPYLNLALAWIPAGHFTMGSPISEVGRKPSEGPQTAVTVPVGFWAGIYPVTQGQYRAVMGADPAEFPRDGANPDAYPVERVSWLQAVEFARQINERETVAGRVPAGYEYRLPTESEWEYFARAGATTAFHFGDKADETNGNFKGSYPRGTGASLTSGNAAHDGTKPVGSYPPNAWGLYDVEGNVREWVLDKYFARLPDGSVTAPALRDGDATARRAYRGGAWNDFADNARSAWRDDSASPDAVSNAVGLRLVLAPKITRAIP